MVILPDYQGVGLGTRFLKSVAEIYSCQGFDFRIVTSAKNLINALNRNTNWKLKSYDKGNTQREILRLNNLQKQLEKMLK